MSTTKRKTKKKTRSVKKLLQPSPMRPHAWTYHGEEVLILKRIEGDRTARGGFTYPQGVGVIVEPETWDPSTSCGGGLHGWPWGFGLGEGMDFDILEDIWLILGAKPEDVVGEIGGGQKCKCRHATIRYEGCFAGAIAFIREGFHACILEMSKVKTPTTSDEDEATLAASGYGSRLAASGYGSQLAASGDGSRLAASGYGSRLAASGDGSRLAASGRNSIAMAAGNTSRVKVGENGIFALSYWADDTRGWNILVGRVGVNGIKANTYYAVRAGKIVEA